MKWKVTCEYRGRVRVEVEADGEQEACDNAVIQADDGVAASMRLYSAIAKPVNDNYHNGVEADYYTGRTDWRRDNVESAAAWQNLGKHRAKV